MFIFCQEIVLSRKASAFGRCMDHFAEKIDDEINKTYNDRIEQEEQIYLLRKDKK